MPNSLPLSAGESASGSVNTDGAARVMVLGGSGFMGRHVTTALAERSIESLVVARRREPNFETAIDLAVAPQADIDQIVSRYRPTAVINCSGAVRGSAEEMMRGNVTVVSNLITALTAHAPEARLVQLGSAAEYGAPATAGPMSERTPARPSSPYGYSKLAATELVLRARSQDLSATVLRIFNVSGPQSPTSTMLGNLIARLQESDTITLDSVDGWRDYVDVRDVAAAAVGAALLADEPPSLMNIGRGEAVRTGDWVEQLLELSGTGARLEVRHDSELEHKASAGQVAWQCADISLARESLNWVPSITFADSLRDTWLAAGSD
jgi:nucleoside-diphosphate-sugar epimerase